MIPILIDRASMPDEAELPPSLTLLADSQRDRTGSGTGLPPSCRPAHQRDRISLPGSPPTTKPEPPRKTVGPSTQPKPTPSSPVENLINSLGMTLVRIEPGEFLMGTTKDQVDQLVRLFPDSKRGGSGSTSEQPQHPVKISRPFFLGIHEVTQGQYQAVMGIIPVTSRDRMTCRWKTFPGSTRSNSATS